MQSPTPAGRPALANRPAPAPQSPTSHIWQAALEKYYNELAKGGMSAATIDKDVWNIRTPDELLMQIQGLGNAQEPRSPAWAKTLSQLEPVITGLSDFAALTAWVMGMNGKVAAVLWGSLRLIVKYAQPVLPDVVGTLENLQRALPRLHKYEEELPMTKPLETALTELYSEIVVFCAYAITFFWSNPNVNPHRESWSGFNKKCSGVINNVRELSRKVDEAALIAKLPGQSSTVETAVAFDALQNLHIQDDADANLPCYTIPYGLNLRFFSRSDELRKLREYLDPTIVSTQLKAIGIHGLGGVGKSQLALQYANTSMDKYALIAWIPSENRIKMLQGLCELATKLGLVDGGAEDDARSVQLVRDWLNKVKRPYLLIFDNVDSVSLLDQIWPANSQARIILTTRSPAQASKRTATTLPLTPFSEESGMDVLQSLSGLNLTDGEERLAADGLCHRVGGLPLALAQLSDFIRDRGYSYGELLRLYDKSAEKLYAKLEAPMEYDHTVLTTWDISTENLSAEARSLQILLAFFDPDSVLERLISETKAEIQTTEHSFLLDEFEFGDAVVELNRTSMINRLSSSKSVSMHRLVQFAVLSRLAGPSRVVYFDLAVKILYFDFPNTWLDSGAHQGHSWSSWETCSAILPHVSRLMEVSEKYRIKSANPELWAELVFRTGAYLWEKEQPSVARSLFEFGLKADPSLPKPLAAQAHRLLGHVCLDLAQPRAALAAYSQALSLRETLEAPESPPIADILDSLACSNVEAGDAAAAASQLDRATAIHEAHDPSKMSRTLAIRAMQCLRAGNADSALDAISRCWQLQGMDQAQIEASRYPKHSGDIMLLARIYWRKGRRAEAKELVSRSMVMRKKTFGQAGGPRVADSLFTLARMLDETGDHILAARALRDVLEMCGDNAPEMRAHQARAFWFLAGVERKLNTDDGTVEELKTRAKEARRQIEEREWADEDSDEGFLRLVGWMLW
ncbi:tpr repeat-containing protein [Cercophora newfieldiana]|uniref:Tpr repeat-containing protein n=1 Tax=Cercophora newfieldiana TaxID=92897 RepID=A0AA39XS22_9PEZI|nr:tpr repeat-containing protein [Cercophora newfieldiana]